MSKFLIEFPTFAVQHLQISQFASDYTLPVERPGESYDGERRIHSALANTVFLLFLQRTDLNVRNSLADLMGIFLPFFKSHL